MVHHFRRNSDAISEACHGDRRAGRPHTGQCRARPQHHAGQHRQCSTAPAQAPRPNLVFIMADDLGWADLSTGLHQRRLRQRLQRDAARSTSSPRRVRSSPRPTPPSSAARPARRCTRASTPPARPTTSTPSVPSRARPTSPLRGVTQGRLAEDGRTAVPVGYTTIGETLQDAGYATGYSGKFHVAGSAEEIVASHGFDENWGGSQNSHATYYFATDDQFNDSVSPSPRPVRRRLHPGLRRREHRALQRRRQRGAARRPGRHRQARHRRADRRGARLHRPEQGRAVPRVGERVRARTSRSTTPRRGPTCSRSTAPRPRRGPGQAVVRRPHRGRGPVGRPHHRLPRGDPGPAQRRQAARRQHAGHLHLRQRRRGGPGQLGCLQRAAARATRARCTRAASACRGSCGARTPTSSAVAVEPTRRSSTAPTSTRRSRPTRRPTLPAGVPLDGIDLTPAFSKGTKINRDALPPPARLRRRAGRPSSSVRDGRWKLYYEYTDGSFELYDLRPTSARPPTSRRRSRAWCTSSASS